MTLFNLSHDFLRFYRIWMWSTYSKPICHTNAWLSLTVETLIKISAECLQCAVVLMCVDTSHTSARSKALQFLSPKQTCSAVVIAHNVYYLLLCIEDQILSLHASAVLPTAAIVIWEDFSEVNLALIWFLFCLRWNCEAILSFRLHKNEVWIGNGWFWFFYLFNSK